MVVKLKIIIIIIIKSSKLYNFVNVGEAHGSYWTRLLDKTTVQDVVRHEDIAV